MCCEHLTLAPPVCVPCVLQRVSKLQAALPATAFVAWRVLLWTARRLLGPTFEDQHGAFSPEQQLHANTVAAHVAEALLPILATAAVPKCGKSVVVQALEVLSLVAYLQAARGEGGPTGGAVAWATALANTNVLAALEALTDDGVHPELQSASLLTMKSYLPTVDPSAVPSSLLNRLVHLAAMPLLGLEVTSEKQRVKETQRLRVDAERRVELAATVKPPKWRVFNPQRSSRYVPRVSGMASTVMDGHLYVFGGSRLGADPPLPFNSLYSIEIDRKGVAGSWKTVTVHMPTADLQLVPVMDHALVSYRHKLYLFGGRNVDALQPQPLLWTFMEIEFQRKGGIVAHCKDVEYEGARPLVRWL